MGTQTSLQHANVVFFAYLPRSETARGRDVKWGRCSGHRHPATFRGTEPPSTPCKGGKKCQPCRKAAGWRPSCIIWLISEVRLSSLENHGSLCAPHRMPPSLAAVAQPPLHCLGPHTHAACPRVLLTRLTPAFLPEPTLSFLSRSPAQPPNGTTVLLLVSGKNSLICLSILRPQESYEFNPPYSPFVSQ